MGATKQRADHSVQHIHYRGSKKLRVDIARASEPPRRFVPQMLPEPIVSAILGHAGIQITADTYGHVLPESKREAIEKMDQLFQRKEGT